MLYLTNKQYRAVKINIEGQLALLVLWPQDLLLIFLKRRHVILAHQAENHSSKYMAIIK